MVGRVWVFGAEGQWVFEVARGGRLCGGRDDGFEVV